jgi:hypothetical protein
MLRNVPDQAGMVFPRSSCSFRSRGKERPVPRHINVSLALILGLAAALNTTPMLAMQDEQCLETEREVQELGFEFELDCESDFFFGLEVAATPEATEASVDEAPYRFYDFRFTGEPGKETGAYIPERFNSEAMVVSVLSGSFAFRTQGQGVIVDPYEDQPLERYAATIPIGPGEDPNIRTAAANESRIFNEAAAEDSFPCELNLPDGRTVCLLDAQHVDEFKQGEFFVRLDPGDTVYLPSNSMCFLCNTEQIGSEPAEVLIWSSTTGFSGALENPPQANSQGTPSAQGPGRFVGWAFNPGSNCK